MKAPARKIRTAKRVREIERQTGDGSDLIVLRRLPDQGFRLTHYEWPQRYYLDYYPISGRWRTSSDANGRKWRGKAGAKRQLFEMNWWKMSDQKDNWAGVTIYMTCSLGRGGEGICVGKAFGFTPFHGETETDARQAGRKAGWVSIPARLQYPTDLCPDCARAIAQAGEAKRMRQREALQLAQAADEFLASDWP